MFDDRQESRERKSNVFSLIVFNQELQQQHKNIDSRREWGVLV